MKVGDLVVFLSKGAWRPNICGRTGLVVAIRKRDRKSSTFDWDCLIDGRVEENFVWYSKNPDWWKDYGVEIIEACE